MEPEGLAEPETERSYATYGPEAQLIFDPLKDLNLPASYEEAMARYKRLRPDPGSESLN
jgi:hypothetical protein